jgi:GNAT superfamily N-acetyltransferase
MQTTLCDASQANAEAVSNLIHVSFSALAAADWDASASTTFLDESSPQAIAAAIASSTLALVASAANRPVGFLLMPSPRLLALLFVHPDYLRNGIGTTLWEAARAKLEVDQPEVQTVELNATPNSVTFYRSVGFVPISLEFSFRGCRATRMACWLPARARNCSVGNAP